MLIFPCERCTNQKPEHTTSSVFSTEQICEVCEVREQEQPEYPAAKAAYEKAVREEDYEYKWPALPAALTGTGG
jgi:hypothetical protein